MNDPDFGWRDIDPRVVGVEFRNHPVLSPHGPHEPPSQTEAESRLLLALASAAQAARAESLGHSGQSRSPAQLVELKRRIDGAATTAAERILQGSRARIEVRAGEGARDASPGATMGQTFGHVGQPVYAALDYVDGTGLAAQNLPNALALGAIGDEVKATPDLRVFAVLAPRTVLDGFTMDGLPESVAADTFQRLYDYRALANQRPLRILTHTGQDTLDAREWQQLLRSYGFVVVVPDPISVETPYILSLCRSPDPLIHAMVGVMGLVELVYSSLLLDALDADFAFRFRLVSSANPKRLLGGDPEAYALTEDEIRAARLGGLRGGVTYSSEDLVRPHSSRLAALFAVTPNDLLRLPAAEKALASGLLVRRKQVFGVTVRYKQEEPCA